jgi:hypothetical protein
MYATRLSNATCTRLALFLIITILALLYRLRYSPPLDDPKPHKIHVHDTTAQTVEAKTKLPIKGLDTKINEVNVNFKNSFIYV